ncbi:MAG TPA: hypothetical protein VFR31_18990 [Thermoanaerobaculia bacterium]|nr:hypothetical protein [Thermoanaerobaculia bacterium]
MSQYTFRIWFTGLMHFVENKDPYAKCQLCVVLPKAQDDHRRKHTGAFYEVSREPYCGKLRLRPGYPIGPDLCRHRVVFRITYTDDIQPQPMASMSFPYGFLHLQDIAGIFADENDQIVSRCPPDTVLAQILIGGEYWFGYDPEISVTRDWLIPQTLTGFNLGLELADPVFVDIPYVEKVEILFYKIDEPDKPACVEVLRPGSNGFIEILAANSCRREEDDCLLDWDDFEFQWLEDGQRLLIMQVDRDFEYHYGLLHPATLEAIKKILPEERFPVPESMLMDILVARHICLEDFFWPKRKPKEETPDEKQTEAAIEQRAAAIVNHWFPDAKLEFFKFLKNLLVVILGTGTGSGNDCLGTKAQARFVGLDDFIPAPAPAINLSALHARAALDRRMSFPPPSDPAYPFPNKQEKSSPETLPKQTTPEPKKD